jgi:hypothetical protein
MSRDIFPPLGIPTIYVAQPYGGMDPAQMEGYLTYRYEYHFLYIAGIEHVGSKSIQGASIMKLQFHPGTDMSQAMSETVAQVNRSRAFMPPGTVAPFIMRFDAGSVAVGYLVFSTDDPEHHAQPDAGPGAQQGAPGVCHPARRVRAAALRRQLARHHRQRRSRPQMRLRAVARRHRAGHRRRGNRSALGQHEPRRQVPDRADQRHRQEHQGPGGRAAEKRTQGRGVRPRCRHRRDGADVTTSYALANGKRTVYLPVTKRADASTLEVVKTVREEEHPRVPEAPAGRHQGELMSSTSRRW